MTNTPQGFHTPDAPRFDEFMSCIKCGLCLPSCPTFQETGLERESPRGRVQLIASVARGMIPLTNGPLADTLFTCLDCRACEVACPSGVPIGTLIEKGRAEVVKLPPTPEAKSSQALSKILRLLLAHPSRLRKAARLLRWAQTSGAIRWAPRLKFLPPGVQHLAQSLRRLPNQSGSELLQAAARSGSRPGGPRVQQFLGCIMDVVFSEANLATYRVLSRNGCQVTVPNGQGCCGALAVHAGDREEARRLARHNIDVFLAQDAQYIATNAGGCGAALLEYPEWFHDDVQYRDKARRFAARVKDAGQILEEVGFRPPTGPFPHRITYQGSCHLHNVMKVGATPERLLQAIPGATYRPMEDLSRCCGSAGVYNLTHPAMATALLRRKMADIPADTEVVVTANPGCWLQMEHGAATIGPKVRVMHLMEVLDQAYQAEHSANSPIGKTLAAVPGSRNS